MPRKIQPLGSRRAGQIQDLPMENQNLGQQGLEQEKEFPMGRPIHKGGRRSLRSRSTERPRRGEFGHRKSHKRIEQGRKLAQKRQGKAGEQGEGEANIAL